MNKFMLAAVVLVVVCVAAGAAYFAVPMLQSPADRLQAEVGPDIERARRLMTRVRQNEEQLEVVLESMRLAGVERLEDARIEELVEVDRELLVNAEQQLQDIGREIRQRRQALQTENRAAEKLPLPLPPAGFGTSVPQMTQALREGLQMRDTLLAENEKLLDQALQTVEKALSAQANGESSANNPMALTLKGTIQYARGVENQRRATIARYRAEEPRSRLAKLAAQFGRQRASIEVVDESGIEKNLEQARTQLRQKEGEFSDLQSQIQDLRQTVSGLESRLNSLLQTASQARQELDRLSNQDFESGSTGDFQTFARRYREQSEIYRQAVSEARVVEFGTLENARIDATGDFIDGEYVPANGSGEIEERRGLQYYRNRVADLQAQATSVQETVERLHQDIQAMEQTRNTLAERGQKAASEVQELRTSVSDAFFEMDDLIAKAEELEEEALTELDDSVTTFERAASALASAQREAAEAAAAYGPQASERSAKGLLSEDRWLPASARARAANAQLRQALIHYQQYRSLEQTADVLADLGDALPDDAPAPQALRDDAAEARSAGIELAEASIDGLLDVTQNMKEHFSLTAEIAAAQYFRSLFDGDQSYVRAAIRNYETVVEGREDSPYVDEYVERLKQLRRRQQKDASASENQS